MTMLVCIDTKSLILARYHGKVCTRAFQFQRQPLPEEIENIRVRPEGFGETTEPEVA